MTRASVLAIVVATVAVGACSGSSSSVRLDGTLTAEGGTSSHVFVGYPGIVRAVQGSRTVTSVSTKPDGSFELSMNPGTYVLIGGWKDQCAAPCNWQAGCGQTAPMPVGQHDVHDVRIVCALK
jgi:hypothetical protein